MAIIPLEIWDRNGVPLFQFGTRVARQLGSFDTTSGDDSRYVPELEFPGAWYVCSPIYGGMTRPMVSRSGATLSWQFLSPPNEPQMPVRIIYGVP